MKSAPSPSTPSSESFEDQCHFMARQSEMLSEEGNDISAKVMLDALRMFTAEHKRAEEATLQLGYMKAGVYQQQAKGWEAITRLLDEIDPGWSTSKVEYDGKTGIQRATEAIRRLSAQSEKVASDSYKDAIAQNLKLRKALEQCVRVAQSWHGDDAFDIYFNHAPEMKLIRDALGKMPDPTEAA